MDFLLDDKCVINIPVPEPGGEAVVRAFYSKYSIYRFGVFKEDKV